VCDLREVDLIMTLGIAQAVLVPVRLAILIHGRGHLLRLLHGAVPLRFKVDADAAIHRRIGHMNVDARHTHLDNLSNHLVGLLVCRYTQLDGVLGVHIAEHTTGQPVLQGRRQLDEPVDLVAMRILNGYSRSR